MQEYVAIERGGLNVIEDKMGFGKLPLVKQGMLEPRRICHLS